MITRRHFLVGAGAAVTVSLLDKFHNYFERTNEPMLIAPKEHVRTLYVYPERDFQMGMGGDPWTLPDERMTWLEFMNDQWGIEEPSSLSEFRAIYWETGVKPSQLRENVGDVEFMEYWERGGPNGIAHRYLKGLDLGPDLVLNDEVAGGLQFFDGPIPGNSYLGVHADDFVSLSILQHRLNAVGENTKVVIG